MCWLGEGSYIRNCIHTSKTSICKYYRRKSYSLCFIYLPEARENPDIVCFFFATHKGKCNTEALPASINTNNIKKRHLVLVGFVCTVKHHDFRIGFGVCKGGLISKEYCCDPVLLIEAEMTSKALVYKLICKSMYCALA